MIALVLTALTILKLAGAVGSLLVLVLLRRQVARLAPAEQPKASPSMQEVHAFTAGPSATGTGAQVISR
jgi:hypothetical protein